MDKKYLLVRCSIEVPIEYEGENEVFDIEDNSCCATGIVGLTINKIKDKYDEIHVCWACKLNCKNEIIKEITKDEYERI